MNFGFGELLDSKFGLFEGELKIELALFFVSLMLPRGELDLL